MNEPAHSPTAMARARAASATVLLVFVALFLAFFPFVPVQLLRRQADERHQQEISRDLEE